MANLRLTLFVLAGSFLLAIGCSGVLRSESGTAAILKRTPCFGTCLDYSVRISRAGAVRLSGGGFIVRSQTERKKIDSRVAQRIFDVTEEVKFFELPSDIDEHCVGSVTDMPGREVSIEIGAWSKHVRERSCATLRFIVLLGDSVMVRGQPMRTDSLLKDSAALAWTEKNEDRFIRESYLAQPRYEYSPIPEDAEEVLRKDSIARDYLGRFNTVVAVIDSVTEARAWAKAHMKVD